MPQTTSTAPAINLTAGCAGLLLLALVTLPGCSSFEREWNERAALDAAAHASVAEAPVVTTRSASSMPDAEAAVEVVVEPVVVAPPPPPGVEGRWAGRWLSDVNGHTGKLRCIVERDAANELVAKYHATYARFLTFRYEMPMTVERDADGTTWRFTAETDLGWLAGGMYRSEGTVVGDTFRATYDNKRDNGIFEMSRVVETPQE